ncbi:hypothetical protein SAMN05421878_11343 [Actinobaculum suis]|uniref:Uncharacterized protein n=1 Tax=Actinobaculum suis TaxID=1657 RepID=A0A1G7DW76_9ACTO|nr:hypothetical protein SAMN05421878_11343 [Actinobaculum suis]
MCKKQTPLVCVVLLILCFVALEVYAASSQGTYSTRYWLAFVVGAVLVSICLLSLLSGWKVRGKSATGVLHVLGNVLIICGVVEFIFTALTKPTAIDLVGLALITVGVVVTLVTAVVIVRGPGAV